MCDLLALFLRFDLRNGPFAAADALQQIMASSDGRKGQLFPDAMLTPEVSLVMVAVSAVAIGRDFFSSVLMSSVRRLEC